ncbi:PepSY domain-containing protein [Sphingobium sp. SCG-1]|uniref:PepSY-associated TM helix domain-containing protein n=1 Tax=Sphingobium sp. SCG-1 TaxID=2072936 RepID=UPI000CD683AF|nr:PepSY-associated TM helix domain-containing protein [Sphingobium sp. SCG-1]AUW57581.1 PepSY domain-containing protein [Sphingobium sp. SCG-1]
MGNQSFRQSMGWLHTWAGILPGWLLFTIFLFGTAAFFQQEISGWMRPELRGQTVSSTALRAASILLTAKAPDADRWIITLPSDRGGEPLIATWKSGIGNAASSGKAILDPTSGREIAVRDTRGGWFLYRFHFELRYLPHWLAEILVCAAALAMLVAIVSGIVIHKRIFADFFTLRFGKGQRSWLDAHNVTAILALPFHLMITYTGLVTLLFTLMPWAISAQFPDRGSYFQAAYPPGPVRNPTGQRIASLSLNKAVSRARSLLDGFAPARIVVERPGDLASIVQLWPSPTQIGGASDALYLDGGTGKVMAIPAVPGIAMASRSVMVDLHAGRFSGAVVRWLYFLSGVGGTVMVASGLVLWTVKRRAKLLDQNRPHFGLRLVERLNVGMITGSCAGIAVFFLSNRLLPFDMAKRAEWEINCLFIAWGAVLVWTLARPVKRAWIEALAACASLYALVPVVNDLTTTRGLFPSLMAQDWIFAGFDLVMLVTAAGCAFTAWKLTIHKPKDTPRRTARELMEAAA